MNRIAAIAAELGLVRPTITPLAGGVSGRTLRLCDARQDLVLRLDDGSGASLGASPESEFVILTLAAAAGLGPAIVRWQPAQGWIALRHVAGRTPDCAGLRQPAFLERLGNWFARLHAVPAPPLPAIDFGARAAGYLERLQADTPTAAIAGLRIALAARRKALAPVARLVCCHHDLHHRNIVDSGAALVAIDWEYAGPGDAAADLAACMGYHELDPAERSALLAGYGTDTAALRERIDALAWIFDCLWYGWNGVAAQAGLALDVALQRRLAARLGA